MYRKVFRSGKNANIIFTHIFSKRCSITCLSPHTTHNKLLYHPSWPLRSKKLPEDYIQLWVQVWATQILDANSSCISYLSFFMRGFHTNSSKCFILAFWGKKPCTVFFSCILLWAELCLSLKSYVGDLYPSSSECDCLDIGSLKR